ncbi:MAG: hypothetical protein ACREV3_12075, partial [Gammaproteobacteria bacterium]
HKRGIDATITQHISHPSEFVKKSSRATGGRVPPERRTVPPEAKRRISPAGASLKDETSNRSVY